MSAIRKFARMGDEGDGLAAARFPEQENTAAKAVLVHDGIRSRAGVQVQVITQSLVEERDDALLGIEPESGS